MDLYRKRRLRTRFQPTLTRIQFRELGLMLNMTSFRQAVEFFMDPFNYFTLSKIKMAEIHCYLLKHGLTTLKCPTTHIRQGDHARLLISILFPGYPVTKSSEAYYQSLRENRGPQVKVKDLAYDRLPTTDRFERLEELFRIKVEGWDFQHCHEQLSTTTDEEEVEKTAQKETIKAAAYDEYSIDIPLKKLNRSIVIEGHADSKMNVRLFMYLWISERMAWTPDHDQLELFVINGNDSEENNCLTGLDRKINEDGFKHIDITEKSDWIAKANRRSTQSIQFKFRFKGQQLPDRIRHVSVCAVIEKSPEELASQLYLQTAALYVGRALEKNSRRPREVTAALQEKAMQYLNQYDMNDRLEVAKMEKLFLSIAETFINEWNDKEDEKVQTVQEADDIEIVASDEVVSVLDPLHICRIQHPARCIFCTHCTSFDAIKFFEFEVKSVNWRCPICHIKIRGIQDLYIDYHTKLALNKYPEEEKFFKDVNDNYTPVNLEQPDFVKKEVEAEAKCLLGSKRKHDVISLDDDNT